MKTEQPEIGRLLKSKAHEEPFYFDGQAFTNLDGTVRLDNIRSDGDYFIKPVFVSFQPPVEEGEKQEFIFKLSEYEIYFGDENGYPGTDYIKITRKKIQPPEQIIEEVKFEVSKEGENQEQLWKEVFHQSASRMDFMQFLQKHFTITRKP